MGFFGIGFGELVVIFVVALLVFGPDKLPDVARTVAKGLKELRKASEDLKASVNLDLDVDAPARRSPPPHIPGSQLTEPRSWPQAADGGIPRPGPTAPAIAAGAPPQSPSPSPRTSGAPAASPAGAPVTSHAASERASSADAPPTATAPAPGDAAPAPRVPGEQLWAVQAVPDTTKTPG